MAHPDGEVASPEPALVGRQPDRADDAVAGVLLQWQGRADERQRVNFAAANRYGAWNLWIGIPLVVLSGLAATAWFRAAAVGRTGWANLAALVPVAVAMLGALQTFLRLGELSEKHRSMAAQYGALKREIELGLAAQRRESGAQDDLARAVKKTLDQLELTEPRVPWAIFKPTRRGAAGPNDDWGRHVSSQAGKR